MTLVGELRLVVLDPPTGKGRPRFNRQNGRPYTPRKTLTAEARIRFAWEQSGSPTLPALAPLQTEIDLYVDRPMAHFKRDGTLTAAGQRDQTPHRQKPDVDNAAKLVLDALEKYAYPRDVAITELVVRRHWIADRHDQPRVEIRIRQLVTEGQEVSAAASE